MSLTWLAILIGGAAMDLDHTAPPLPVEPIAFGHAALGRDGFELTSPGTEWLVPIPYAAHIRLDGRPTADRSAVVAQCNAASAPRVEIGRAGGRIVRANFLAIIH